MVRLQLCVPYGTLLTRCAAEKRKSKRKSSRSRPTRLQHRDAWARLPLHGSDRDAWARLCRSSRPAVRTVGAVDAAAQLREQVLRAQSQPWRAPFGRDYSWFVAVFMIALVQRLQLVLLQELDGRFEMTQDLANLLWAGAPQEPLETHPYPYFDLEELRAQVPGELQEVMGRAPPHLSAEAVWATMCALELYSCQPLMSEWLENPNDPPAERQTLRQRAQLWLDNYVGPHVQDGDLR
eukprot:gene9817-11630_t